MLVVVGALLRCSPLAVLALRHVGLLASHPSMCPNFSCASPLADAYVRLGGSRGVLWLTD